MEIIKGNVLKHKPGTTFFILFYFFIIRGVCFGVFLADFAWQTF